MKELANGLFVFVGTVKPTMVSQANCGAKSYKLWFVMDGEKKTSESQNSSTVWSPTTGSILSAYCCVQEDKMVLPYGTFQQKRANYLLPNQHILFVCLLQISASN